MNPPGWPSRVTRRTMAVAAVAGVAAVLLVWGSRPGTARFGPVAAAGAAQTCPAGERAHREYVLEVIGLGVTLDEYRQGGLWEALQQGGGQADIRERDPRKIPWSVGDKRAAARARSAATLANGAGATPMYWGVPTFYAGPPGAAPDRHPFWPDAAGAAGASGDVGLRGHLFLSASWKLSERPDQLLEQVFAYFDEHPDLPYVVLSAGDGLPLRDAHRPKGSGPLLRSGRQPAAMPDASVLLVLARRERVDLLRPFAFKDGGDTRLGGPEVDRRGVARRLGLAYAGAGERWLRVEDWQTLAPEVVQREHLLQPAGMPGGADSGPPRGYKPTPWFPLPWNQDQLASFDRLPTLGYLHRPVFVPLVDDDFKPFTAREQRAAALAAGWQQALTTLPEADRPAAPARVIGASAGSPPDGLPAGDLGTLFDGWAEQRGAAIDRSRPEQWIDTQARLGNLGAATWFMQIALGVMGSYRDGGVSAAINLRDPRVASIVLISPPPPSQRRLQQHPLGGDVFRDHSARAGAAPR